MFVGKIIMNTIDIFFLFESIKSLNERRKVENKEILRFTCKKFERRISLTVNFIDHDRLQV